MTRRQMLSLMTALPLTGKGQAAQAEEASLTLSARDGEANTILSAPLTHSDWMLKPGIVWGEAGVRHMLDVCKAAGWSRIYWRAFDSGRATYRSKLLDAHLRPEPNNIFQPQTAEERTWTAGVSEERRAEIVRKQSAMDYAAFDSLDCAVEYGHRIGLQVHAWLSINEDDHGWGWRSRFAIAHPESRWRRRDGTFFHSQQSYAFPQVRAYKLRLIEEIVQRYAIDGLFLDWIRTGDVRDNPQTDADGVANYGYEEPLLAAFKKRYSLDPRDLPNGDERWVRFRAEPQTVFMRSVRKRLRALKPKLPLAVMVSHPWAYRGYGNKKDGSLRGLLLDVKTWAQEGLIDAAVPEGYYRDGGNVRMAYEHLQKETEGKADIWFYGWVPDSPASFERDFALAQQLGAKQMFYWEADYLDDRKNLPELQAAMRKRARLPS